MIPRPLDRSGLCVCGLGVALHFDDQNRKLTCEQTADQREAAARAAWDARAARAATSNAEKKAPAFFPALSEFVLSTLRALPTTRVDGEQEPQS